MGRTDSAVAICHPLRIWCCYIFCRFTNSYIRPLYSYNSLSPYQTITRHFYDVQILKESFNLFHYKDCACLESHTTGSIIGCKPFRPQAICGNFSTGQSNIEDIHKCINIHQNEWPCFRVRHHQNICNE